MVCRVMYGQCFGMLTRMELVFLGTVTGPDGWLHWIDMEV